MELKYNVTGSERKSLVGAISTALGAPTTAIPQRIARGDIIGEKR